MHEDPSKWSRDQPETSFSLGLLGLKDRTNDRPTTASSTLFHGTGSSYNELRHTGMICSALLCLGHRKKTNCERIVETRRHQPITILTGLIGIQSLVLLANTSTHSSPF